MNAARKDSTLTAFLKAVVSAFSGSPARDVSTVAVATDAGTSPGQRGDTATREVTPPAAGGLRITYAPDRDGDPDAGEVIWTWVPYDENDGRGKDRPVLVIARQDSDRVYAVRLTSKSHDGDRDFLSIGSGEWDSQGRESWVDIEQVYSIHTRGMRREAAVLDLTRFARVAQALQARYGWSAGA
ncbi:type II toxin-antitoxin system PemK/MazF family toxin [uncultured Microbacterium sp.]|uniref:type II toxin-antitoxin system PemK/MazF family toxin n=1 Tax=uncultured Microbacterium sp. TaxID=191216 RepID=UPI0026132D2D|nr:type II toxin-antitoxin system PemK/MazF family toxin [uncultured Microbacterium sp.]